MADGEFIDKHSDLELEVGHGVAVDLRNLVKASERFSALIDEIASDVAGKKRPVRWVVEVEPGSVKLPLRAEPALDDLRAGVVEQMGEIIAGGLRRLQNEAIRPDHFTDRALELAKEFASASSAKLPIAVRNGHAPVRITAQLGINAEKVLGEPRESIGTIEGRLDALNVHGTSREFSIWPTGNKAVKCSFAGRLDLDADILPAVRKRVAAHGRIKTRPNGERLSVLVDDLRVIGDAPVSADEVEGILKGYEAAEW
jgi:hypothetical protein